MFRIVGLREEKYVGQVVRGHNCDFTYTDEELVRHVILAVEDTTGEKVELTLSESQGECGSGWCTASWGEWDYKKVDTFAGKTHTTKYSTPLVDLKGSVNGTFECDFFSFDYDGGCGYYPYGGYSINMGMFEEV